MTVLRYSVLRLLLFIACLLVLWLVGVREPVLLVALTAIASLTLSYFFLRGPRDAMAQTLADRAARRQRRPDADELAEDAEDETPPPA
ncbi:MAG TPA: DUF4229 domain-containing protein [Actinomycetales bacterium]|nr:DUF4229 domain-containing protein [Actinomycetales bacterium]